MGSYRVLLFAPDCPTEVVSWVQGRLGPWYDVLIVRDSRELLRSLRRACCAVALAPPDELDAGGAWPGRPPLIQVTALGGPKRPCPDWPCFQVLSALEVADHLGWVVTGAVIEHLLASCRQSAVKSPLFVGRPRLRTIVVELFGNTPSLTAKGAGRPVKRSADWVRRQWHDLMALNPGRVPRLAQLQRAICFLGCFADHLRSPGVALDDVARRRGISAVTLRRYCVEFTRRTPGAVALDDILTAVQRLERELLSWLLDWREQAALTIDRPEPLAGRIRVGGSRHWPSAS